MDPRIRTAVDFIKEKCHLPLSVGGLAKQVGLSCSRFEHLFRENAGMSFRERLCEAHLQTSKVLLADRHLSIKEVAHASGYSSSPTFARNFRKRFGVAPSDFRSSSG